MVEAVEAVEEDPFFPDFLAVFLPSCLDVVACGFFLGFLFAFARYFHEILAFGHASFAYIFLAVRHLVVDLNSFFAPPLSCEAVHDDYPEMTQLSFASHAWIAENFAAVLVI